MWTLENVKIDFFHSSWSENDFNYSDITHKAFKESDKGDIRMVQNLTVGAADLKQFTRLRD